MIRKLSLSFVAVALSAFSASANVCVAPKLKIRTVTLYANGTVSRTVQEERKLPSPQNGKPAKSVYVAVERDRAAVEYGDELLFNTDPEVVDALFQVKIALVDKQADAQGVFYSTFQVTELNTSLFSGTPSTTKNMYFAKITSNYIGNGTFTKGCGRVTKSRLAPPVEDQSYRR